MTPRSKPALAGLLALLLSTPMILAKPSKAEEKFLAQTWSANKKIYENKPVETYVTALGNTGTITSAQPFAAVPVTTATAGGEEGGEIILLLPPSDAEKVLKALMPKKAASRSAFGNKQLLQKLSGTFRIVAGEPVIVKGGDASKLAEIGKPSAIYARQTAATQTRGKTGPMR